MGNKGKALSRFILVQQRHTPLPLSADSSNEGPIRKNYPLYKGAAPKNREIVRPKIPDNHPGR